MRVIPHLEQLEVVFQYLAELGALHQKKGVKRHHIDLGKQCKGCAKNAYLLNSNYGACVNNRKM